MTFLKQFMKWSYASLYTILSERSCKWLIFLFSTLHWTSKLVDSSQTRLQWRISLGLSFVLESYNFTTLLKQTISYQRFLHKFEMRSSKDNALSICTPSIFFFLLDSQIPASPIFELSCLYPLLRKWHLSSFNLL